MNSPVLESPLPLLKNPIYKITLWIFAILLLGFTYSSSLNKMMTTWIDVEEYSHGFFIPIISGYLLWLRRAELRFVERFSQSLPGLLLVVIGLVLFILGGLATLKTVEQYSFIVTLAGVFTIAFGPNGLKIGRVPLLFLFFMVPFPAFILFNLSSKLQLISSWLGVEFIRSCDIMVYLEGNVIDLGGYKLQVVDACSGLRYLFPLASLSFLCAYLFKGTYWQKALIFISSAPLTVFMNSFRIGVIGILVNYWGTEMAEGFLHDFEGWIVFLFCMLFLFIEMWLFARLNGQKVPFGDLVMIPTEWVSVTNQTVLKPAFNSSLFLLVLMLAITTFASNHINNRKDILPIRKPLTAFPLQINDWYGRNEYLDEKTLKYLKLTDYVVADYERKNRPGRVNFYSAYYQSQRDGASVHSPKGCIPGDGWQIAQFGQSDITGIFVDGKPLRVNRAIIEKGEYRQLVYYWFQQRGRTITNEYLVKWYLFSDAVTMNRTDGSLIRLVTEVGVAENMESADGRLKTFLKGLTPILPAYIPGRDLQIS